ncbi:uncharacterized protein LOC141668000 isoform X2 [Apium graveolens]|uniref:uncharacterized protein LOC141668000 isoform X2 n=1 Tax=Apium graveolens TaxID=4045 RepID=UPI003D7AA60D
MVQEGPNLFIRQIICSQVVWASLNSWKGKENKGKESNGDEESYVEGTHEVGESSRKIIFERKRRNCSEGDYSSFLENTPKKTLGHIFRMKFDDETIRTRGASREAFYSPCIKNFKEYYTYPFPYDKEDGDQVVRSYLHRNLKSYLIAERGRLVEKVKHLLEAGYTEKDFNIRDEGLEPYYYSQHTWNSVCDCWEAEKFKKLSTNGQNARSNVEFVSRRGAEPFEQRRQEINEKRAAKGEFPISEDEFMGIAYNPTQPAVQDLQARIELAPEFELIEEPSSPRAQREFYKKKRSLCWLMQDRQGKGRSTFIPKTLWLNFWAHGMHCK